MTRPRRKAVLWVIEEQLSDDKTWVVFEWYFTRKDCEQHLRRQRQLWKGQITFRLARYERVEPKE